MTIDEAIEIVKELWKYEKTKHSEGKIREALDMAKEALEYAKPSGSYQCFHCGEKSVTWDADFDFSDFGYEGVGIVHCCHCNSCGAEIEYSVRFDEED